MNTVDINPLRQVAIALTMLKTGERDTNSLPTQAYIQVCNELNRLPRKGRPLSYDGRALIARSLLTGTPLHCMTFICVSDYVGGERYRKQQHQYALTEGEIELFQRIEAFRAIAQSHNLAITWNLMLADAWGLSLYPDRLIPGAIEEYCGMMDTQCVKRGLSAVRWLGFMLKHESVFNVACGLAQPFVEQLAPLEALRGEIAHDKPSPEKVLELAKQHVRMRAAEGLVIREVFGPTLVLSTETHGERKYDNLLVSRSQYCAVDYMPFRPHRLP